MARYGMVIDTTKCVGCMDCVVACKTENEVPEGLCRDWIVQEVGGAFPDLRMEIRSERCNHCDNPPCVYCCPTGASHISELGQDRSDHTRAVYRLQSLLGLLPLRRSLHPSRRLRRQVHLLCASGRRRAGPGLCRGLPHPLYVLWRSRRPRERGESPCWPLASRTPYCPVPGTRPRIHFLV